MNKCKVCGKETKNKVYCSVLCQHKGYKVNKVKRIIKICEYCGNEFSVKETSKHPHKFCSRKCTDLWKKENPIKGEEHHNYGKKHTKEWKKSQSNKMQKIWKSQEHRNKVTNGQQKFLIEHGYWCGTDEKSKKKRRETMLEKYGIEHNWNGKFGERGCDKTFVEKYGMTSVEYCLLNLLNTNKTSIEIIIENILISSNINYMPQCRIGNRFFDFYLPEYNVLIEADGDYWHGKGLGKSQLNEAQSRTRKNDIYKNNLAKRYSMKLYRFWEEDIKKSNFIDVIGKIWEKK